MENKMWFGTRGYMQWVPCPDINGDHSKVGWVGKSQYLNGGAGLRRSTASHKEYVLSWNVVSRDEIRPVLDYADGLYDANPGVNLIYFHDPMTLDRNVLPQMWASPAQATRDGLSLFSGQTPTAVATPSNSLRYPARSAVYRSNTNAASLWVPIPPGHTAWIGAHGSATGDAGVTYATTQGGVTSTPQMLPMQAVTDSTRFSTSVNSSGTVDGIQLGFTNLGPSSSDTVILSGMMVQILPTGVSPQMTGPFISGQGHSGCQFDGQPAQTPHSAAFDLMGVSATLIETGSWL